MQRFVVPILLLSLAIGLAPAAPARAAVPMVPTGIVFNRPAAIGSANGYEWVAMMRQAIDGTPRRQTITVAMYSLFDRSIQDALVAADRRGVKVRIVGYSERREPFDLIKPFIHNTRGSWVKVCTGSCMGAKKGHKGVQHMKIITISKFKSRGKWIRWFSSVSSSNLSNSVITSWNESRNWSGNKKIYSGLKRYIETMRADKPYRGAAKVVRSGSVAIYLYPQKAESPDLALNTLRATTCAAPAGYGANGRTVIRVAMFQWSVGRTDIAHELARLQAQGCDIRLILTMWSTALSPTVHKILADAGIPMRDGVYINSKGVYQFFQHAKTMIISGSINGRGAYRTFSGSQNWTRGGQVRNNEALVVDTSKATSDAYLTQWEIWNRWTTPARSAAAKALETLPTNIDLGD